jgi:hypothetical protein
VGSSNNPAAFSDKETIFFVVGNIFILTEGKQSLQ